MNKILNGLVFHGGSSAFIKWPDSKLKEGSVFFFMPQKGVVFFHKGNSEGQKP